MSSQFIDYDFTKLRDIIALATFDVLRVLCDDLDEDYDDIVRQGTTKKVAALEIVKFFRARDRADELVTRARREFPKANWNEVVLIEKKPQEVEKPVFDPHLEIEPLIESELLSHNLSEQHFDVVIFSQLSSLLQDKKWREADVETYRVLMLFGDGMKNMRLGSEAIESLPILAIHTIDDLWTYASGKQFGFKAQARIWRMVAKPPSEFSPQNLRSFANYVRWYIDGAGLRYDNLSFTTDAPVGHLPSLQWRNREKESGWWSTWRDQTLEFLKYFSSRL